MLEWVPRTAPYPTRFWRCIDYARKTAQSAARGRGTYELFTTFLRGRLTAAGPRNNFVGNGSFDKVDAPRQPPLTREFDDSGVEGWDEAEGDSERAGERRETAEAGLDRSRQHGEKPETYHHQPSQDSCTIERQVVRQNATEFWRSGGAKRNQGLHASRLFTVKPLAVRNP
jgi:hypothetical protein